MIDAPMGAMGTMQANGSQGPGWARGKRLTNRFVVERRLGAGGMGVVYEVLDEQRGEAVALKTLGRIDGASAYKIKKEFRALADLVHPNLVRLHELFADDEAGLFFTMARVDGVPFDAYARIAPMTAGPLDDTATVTSTGHVRGTELRAALAQLAVAVQAIHRAGMIHRDLKPANVLVSSNAHVTILDFGLVEPAVPDVDRSIDLAGTPSYMAPEQLKPGGACAASDWYAVGMMLYEALSGELPFTGDAQEILLAKLAGRPARPIPRVAPGLEDLADLAMALLDPSPDRRPSGDLVVSQLAPRAAATVATPVVSPPRSAPFVGRDAELAQLRAAFEAVSTGESRTVWVEGTSGIGKSALVERFLEDLRFTAAGADAVVLSGRCYEREAVPFKAIDAVIDALSRTLTRMDRIAAARMAPRDLDDLCRVFPVLGRVPAFTGAERAHVTAASPEIVRRRATEALREVFARLGSGRPVVITVDDMQWGDVDSGHVLAQLVAPPDPPRLLLVGTYRREDVERSPLLTLLRAQAKHEGYRMAETISLAPLDEPAALALATSLGAAESARAKRIAEESGGSPFFIAELARSTEGEPAASLTDVVSARVGRLPGDAQSLLEVVAIAGRPVPTNAALTAAGLAPHDDAAVPLLRASSLLRATTTTLEAYHDRIREIVGSSVAISRRRAIHRALGEALAATPGTPPDALYTHFLEAGLEREAHVHALAAARNARDALAFGRAAEMYQRALELVPEADVGDLRTLTRELADALALAGKGAASADAYLRAAQGASADDVTDLERRAALELLGCGDLDRGLAIADRLAKRIGVWVPNSIVLSALIGIGIIALYLWRGIRPPTRGSTELDAQLARHFDVLYSIGGGLAMIETARAPLFVARALRVAERMVSGSRRSYAVLAATEIAAAFVRPGHPGLVRLRAQADGAARSLADNERAEFEDLRKQAEGGNAFLAGRWRLGRDLSLEAEPRIEHLIGRRSELINARVFGTWSLFYLGELAEHNARCRRYAREARVRGDRLLLNAMLNTWGPLAHLSNDDSTTARDEAVEAFASWPGKRFQLQHYWHLLALGCVDLYVGEARDCRQRMERQWSGLRSSGILLSPLIRTQMLHLRAGASLATAANTKDEAERRTLRTAAERHARAFERAPVIGSAELAMLLLAGAARTAGDDALARERLAVATEVLERADMRGYAMAAKRHLGVLLGGDEGHKLVDGADAYFVGEGIKRPDRFAAMLAPGFDA